MLCVFYLLSMATGSLIRDTASALGGTVGAAGRGTVSSVSGIAQNNDGDALKSKVRRLVNPNDAQTAQDNITFYFCATVSGDEARTWLNNAEQQARAAADQAKQKAQAAAEVTRKGVAGAGVPGFVALALGPVASWFGGVIGAPRRSLTTIGVSIRRI